MRPIDLNPGEALLHEGDPARCAVVLPGIRYFSQAPLLWFAREVAQARGWSVLELSERAPAEEDPLAWMRDRASAALDLSEAQPIVVIGKSLGSVAAPLVAERALAAVWLTPLLDRPEIASAIASSPSPALVVGSKADPTWADGPRPGAALDIMEFEGLDHSLQVRSEPLASLEVLRSVVERIGGFFQDLG